MANKGNSDAELPPDKFSSSLSKENEKTEEIDTKQYMDDSIKEGKIQEQSTDTNDPKSNPEPDATSENSSEPVEQQKVISALQDVTTSGLPLESQTAIQPEDEKEKIQKQSTHTNDPDTNQVPDTTSENSSEPVEQQKVTSSLQGMTTSGFPQARQTAMNDSESKVEPDTTVESENSTSSVPEEKLEESPLNIQNPEEEEKEMAREINKENVEDESKVQDQGSNTQTIQEQSSHRNDLSDPDPGATLKNEIRTSSETEEKQKVNTESPLNIQKPKGGEKEEEMARDINKENVEDESKVQDQGSNKTLWTVGAVGVVLLAVFCAFTYSPDSTSPKPNEFNVVEVFNEEMKKLETNFPNQHPELWRRSLIHLRRHLKTKNPSEPVSLILTSGHRAEKTLDCLARNLAQAFSTAINSSVLNINGKSKASQDSDQVKLDIDRELRNAFDGEKSAAVIHRFEELPPGSTLIFYRYCDHENAAYKNVFLAFTVMLDAEVEVPSNVSLGRVEEMVQEHIKRKFVSSDKSAMFNQMDVDKLSGLWSRISHLILPVAAEEKIEQQGCEDFDKSF
ncbi:torsin-1A-interacting protein 2 isoform X2 [Labeo rohita]|uniref:torsin-1A-interacting protein 2 isoform X2 n=1 Tax=Labeo rohita TaxID=84645 RepID=UPI0021E1DAD9|nr:torsin-1A-interacting protein 2 isoform X2 [Labeo rohita]